MPNTYTELLKTTVGTATSSVTLDLTGISGYTDLVLVINNTHSTNAVDGWFRLNGDTGSNYSRTNLSGDGSSASSGRNSNVAFGYGILVYTTPSTNILQFMNYANTTTYKTVLMRSNNAGNYVQATVDLWRNTNAITSIEIGCASGNYAVGSTFSLYGIANADQGAAKATGGIITEDATYWYHTFGASGAFIPKQSLTCDVLVVAGGGGGGSYRGGGGGAGGLLGFTSQSLTATTYNVTVGSGGAGGANNTTGSVGTVGVDSQFGALTLVKGGGRGGAPGTGPSTGGNGGSGGGAAADPSTSPNPGGSPTTSQGNAGGSGAWGTNYYGAGGGGGAGAAGGNGSTSSTTGASGGIGSTTYSSWGLATGTGQNVSGTVYYAGGGGGGHFSSIANHNGSSGGLGGGGGVPATTTSTTGVNGVNGTSNTGGGGGGTGSQDPAANHGTGGNGGSGVVVIRYAK
jgi:hypothetical protein